jgi:hypothetical protein
MTFSVAVSAGNGVIAAKNAARINAIVTLLWMGIACQLKRGDAAKNAPILVKISTNPMM